jgi:hypothetical protein
MRKYLNYSNYPVFTEGNLNNKSFNEFALNSSLDSILHPGLDTLCTVYLDELTLFLQRPPSNRPNPPTKLMQC